MRPLIKVSLFDATSCAKKVSCDSTMAENTWSIVSASDVNCEWDYVANGLAGPCKRA